MTYNERAEKAKTEKIPEWMFSDFFEITHPTTVWSENNYLQFQVALRGKGWRTFTGYGPTISEAANAARKLREEAA